MNAREHYEASEAHLTTADAADGGSNNERYHLAAAQVHATLALAAAHGADQPTMDELMPVPKD